MTALPYDPNHLYTVQEYAALPDGDTHRHELQEGVLVASPSPTPLHMIVVKRLGTLLDEQLPQDLIAVPGVDVNLELGVPPSVRRPDMVVVRAAALDRADLLRASDAVLVVEVVSPESVRRDTRVKVIEYADTSAGEGRLRWLGTVRSASVPLTPRTTPPRSPCRVPKSCS